MSIFQIECNLINCDDGTQKLELQVTGLPHREAGLNLAEFLRNALQYYFQGAELIDEGEGSPPWKETKQ